MAIQDIIRGRLVIMIKKNKKDEDLLLDGSNKLGSPPIGFSADHLHEFFLIDLNEGKYGFDDFLKENLAEGDLNRSTKVDELATKIIKKAKEDLNDLDKYKADKAKILETALPEMISECANEIQGDGGDPIPPSDIKPEMDIKEIMEDEGKTDLLIKKLIDEINIRYQKYLLARIGEVHLSLTVGAAQGFIVKGMVGRE